MWAMAHIVGNHHTISKQHSSCPTLMWATIIHTDSSECQLSSFEASFAIFRSVSAMHSTAADISGLRLRVQGSGAWVAGWGEGCRVEDVGLRGPTFPFGPVKLQFRIQVADLLRGLPLDGCSEAGGARPHHFIRPRDVQFLCFRLFCCWLASPGFLNFQALKLFSSLQRTTFPPWCGASKISLSFRAVPKSPNPTVNNTHTPATRAESPCLG